MWEKIKSFLNVKPPKTELADSIRQEAFEKERLKLAVIEGKKEAQLQSEKRLEKLEEKQKEAKPKTNWGILQSRLQSISNSIDTTFKPSNKQKKQKEDVGDGISPTFSLYK